ncbi:MAG TPA: hypothetical protein VGE74_14695 [Gemmata sp.]
MIAYLLYTPLAVALAVLFFYSARGALRGYGSGRLVPFTLAVAAALFGSLYLMFVVDLPWVAVGVAAVVAVPVLAPVTLMLVAVGVSWLTGKPMRWN